MTPEEEIQLMDNFEAVAFAGLQPDQYNILWVRHSHAGHHELHFVIPRMELSTGKAFNAFPPGWQHDFAPLRDYENIRHGWTRPDDPERARLFAPSSADIIEARLTRWGQNPAKQEKEQARDAINAYVKTLVEGGTVGDRADIVTALRDAGLEINREGKDYITVKDPDRGEKIRLKGGVYGAGWTLEKFSRAHEGKGRTGTDTDGERLQGAIADLERQLDDIIAKRATYNVGRYGAGDYGRGLDLEPALPPFELCVRQEMDHDDDPGLVPVLRGDAGRVGLDEARRPEAEQIQERVGADGGRPSDSPRSGGEFKQDARGFVGTDFGDRYPRAEREPLRDDPAGERERPHHQRQTGNQIEGVSNHEQKRAGTHSIGLPGADRDGSDGGTLEPGREDSEDRNAGGGLRAAVDAAIRIVTEFRVAYRRAERYLAEHGKTVEREAERKPRGMSR